MIWYEAEDAEAAGANRKRQRKWFKAGWNARDRRTARQIKAISESYMADMRLLQERVELARWERDQLKGRAVPEGYIVLAESTCTLDPEDSVTTYRIVKEDEWDPTIYEGDE